MRKWTGKQWGLIIVSLIIAFVVQYVLWLLVMGHPGNIDAMYHILTTVCLAGAFVLIGDKLVKANLYK